MVREPDATRQPTPHDIQLTPKHRVLSFKPQLRLEWRGQDGQNETEQPDHSASLGDSITASTRIRFSVHTGSAECLRWKLWRSVCCSKTVRGVCRNVSANAGPNTDRRRFASPQGLRSPGASLRSDAHQIGWSRLGDPRRNCGSRAWGSPMTFHRPGRKPCLSTTWGAHGIAYHARHDDEALCYAIFDRARSAIKEVERETDLDKNWFWRLAQEYKVGMAPN